MYGPFICGGSGGGSPTPTASHDLGYKTTLALAVAALEGSTGKKMASSDGASLNSIGGTMKSAEIDLTVCNPGTLTKRASATTGSWSSGNGVLLPDVGYLTFDQLGDWFVGALSVTGKFSGPVASAVGNYMALGYQSTTANYMLGGGAAYDGSWKGSTVYGTSTTLNTPLYQNTFTMPAGEFQAFADTRKTDSITDNDAGFFHGVIVPTGVPSHRGSLSGVGANADETDGRIFVAGKGTGPVYLTHLSVVALEKIT